MKRKGSIALEAVIASALTLVLLTALASLLIVFWQSWHQISQGNRQRQWAAMAFEYLDRDIREAEKVLTTARFIQITHPDGIFQYKVSSNSNSFHRAEGTIFYALALVDSANWWWEGELLWVELNFPTENYRSCYYIPEGKR